MKALIATACVVVILIGGSIIGKYVYDSFDMGGEQARQFERARDKLMGPEGRDQWRDKVAATDSNFNEVFAARTQGKKITDEKLRADLDAMEWGFAQIEQCCAAYMDPDTLAQERADIAWAKRRLKVAHNLEGSPAKGSKAGAGVNAK